MESIENRSRGQKFLNGRMYGGLILSLGYLNYAALNTPYYTSTLEKVGLGVASLLALQSAQAGLVKLRDAHASAEAVRENRADIAAS